MGRFDPPPHYCCGPMFVEEQRVSPHFELTHLHRERGCCYLSMSKAEGFPRLRVTVTQRIAHSAIHRVREVVCLNERLHSSRLEAHAWREPNDVRLNEPIVLLTGRQVVVDVRPLQLQHRVADIVPGRVDAMLVTDHFPELHESLKKKKLMTTFK